MGWQSAASRDKAPLSCRPKAHFLRCEDEGLTSKGMFIKGILEFQPLLPRLARPAQELSRVGITDAEAVMKNGGGSRSPPITQMDFPIDYGIQTTKSPIGVKMFSNDTDRDWEKFGKEDPYYSVVTHDKFHKTNLTDANKEEFFRSGSIYIDSILDDIKNHIDSKFSIKRALDFGCGVGRLVIPLATVAQEVTGVDISDSMLNEAKNNCEARSIKNIRFVKSDDTLSLLEGKYDFIHSVIVFQHIPTARGEQIFQKLLELLEEDGIGVVHFTYAKDSTRMKTVALIKKYVPMAHNFINLINKKHFFAPRMQMNTYNLNNLFYNIQRANIRDCYSKFSDNGGSLGIAIYFKKPKTAQ